MSKNNKLCTTGVPGLDDVLRGGLPKNRLYLIEGEPGVGKTTLAIQFLREGARRGEKGLYITLSETKDELLEVAKSHGWSLDDFSVFELSGLEQQLNIDMHSTVFHPSEIELGRITKVLLEEITRIAPERLIFDSLSEMRLLAENPLRYRRQVLTLKQFFAGRQCTVFFLDDFTSTEKDLQVESIAHGVIIMEKSSPDYGVTRRRLNVAKVRGVGYREGNHDYVIRQGGIEVFPRLVAAEHYTDFSREGVGSDLPELDALLGDGLHRGTATILMGPAGTGKSTIAMQFAVAAAKRGEKVAMFCFEENVGTVIARAVGVGFDVQKHINSGMITIGQIDPAELSPGELTHSIRTSVEQENTRMVIIDSLNGYLNAMPEERFLNLQLHEVFSFLNQKGVTSILVLAQQGMTGHMQVPVDLTYLADSVIMLRFFEAFGSVKLAISAIKKRTGPHERTIREFTISSQGLRVGPPLKDFQGVLTGVPQFHGKAELISTDAAAKR